MHKLVFCRALHPDAMALLKARKDVNAVLLSQDFRGPPMTRELAEALPGSFGVMIGLERFSEELLASAPGLRVISRFGVGYDSVDVPACTQHGVLLTVVNGANDLSVAEHAMMFMLMLARRGVEYDASVRAGTWMIQTGRRMHEPTPPSPPRASPPTATFRRPTCGRPFPRPISSRCIARSTPSPGEW